MSPAQPFEVQPTRSRLPPYSGGPYIASSVFVIAAPRNVCSRGLAEDLPLHRHGRVGEDHLRRSLRALVEQREPLAVDLLEAFHGTGELALLDPERAFEPDPPPELGLAIERDEVREVVPRRAGPIRERAAGDDQRWVDVERSEQQVDRLRNARLDGARGRVLGRPGKQTVRERGQRRQLVRCEEVPMPAARVARSSASTRSAGASASSPIAPAARTNDRRVRSDVRSLRRWPCCSAMRNPTRVGGRVALFLELERRPDLWRERLARRAVARLLG